MKRAKNENITKVLRNKYRISIGLLIMLVLLNQILVQHAMNIQQQNAELINMAGKQRMYSQRIVKAALGICQCSAIEDKSQYRMELWASLAQWEQNHRKLQSDYGEIKSIFDLNRDLNKLYQEIQDPFREMSQAARQLLLLMESQGAEEEALREQLRIIQTVEPLFLQGMEEIVDHYEEETKTVISRTERLENWILVSSIFIILMVSLFVFGPAVKELEEKIRDMREGRDNLAKLFHTAPNPLVLIRKRDNHVMLTNRQAGELFHIREGEEASLNLNHMQMREEPEGSLVNRLMAGNELESVEIILGQQPDQEGERHFHLSSRPIWYQGEKALIISLTDISRLKEAEEILRKDATTDHMTGLLNKHYGLQLLEEKLKRSREDSKPLAVCFMDIDYLKLVNDQYGHEEGDAYIKKMADLLIRNTGMNDVVFRYGGDEMVAIFDNCDRPCAEKILKRLEASVHHLAEASEKPYPVHASFGLALSTEKPEADAEKLLSIADQAMYESKKRYKESLGENAPELR
jgi:diguanylate cyclase (GGDEF)-like protein